MIKSSIRLSTKCYHIYHDIIFSSQSRNKILSYYYSADHILTKAQKLKVCELSAPRFYCPYLNALFVSNYSVSSQPYNSFLSLQIIIIVCNNFCFSIYIFHLILIIFSPAKIITIKILIQMQRQQEDRTPPPKTTTSSSTTTTTTTKTHNNNNKTNKQTNNTARKQKENKTKTSLQSSPFSL